MMANITFLSFLLFSMCHSIHVAVNTWLNCSFFTLIKIKDHPSESDLKSKSLVQKDQNQNHKDIVQLFQHSIYVQKFSEIMPLYYVQKCIRTLSIQ